VNKKIVVYIRYDKSFTSKLYVIMCLLFEPGPAVDNGETFRGGNSWLDLMKLLSPQVAEELAHDLKELLK